jgi:hypothetical protein
MALEQVETALSGSQADQRLVERARLAFIADCMAKSGFPGAERYYAPPPMSEPRKARLERSQLDLWWGVSLPDSAARFGYHEVQDPASPRPKFTDDDVPPGLQEALTGSSGDSTGDSPGGCLGEWNAIVYDDVGFTPAEFEATVAEIRLEIEEVSHGLDATTQATERWSECMAENRITFTDPHVAFTQFVGIEVTPQGYEASFKTVEPTDEEKHIATADAQCKLSVGFWDAIDQAENEAARQLVESSGDKLEDLRKANKKIAQNASESTTPTQQPESTTPTE